jgi:hypothetical protein
MFIPLNGLLRLFLTGFPSGVVFLGPWATRADKSMRAGPRFWKLATPRVCRHGVRRVLERACASQKGHADDVRRSMLDVGIDDYRSKASTKPVTCRELSPLLFRARPWTRLSCHEISRGGGD